MATVCSEQTCAQDKIGKTPCISPSGKMVNSAVADKTIPGPRVYCPLNRASFNAHSPSFTHNNPKSWAVRIAVIADCIEKTDESCKAPLRFCSIVSLDKDKEEKKSAATDGAASSTKIRYTRVRSSGAYCASGCNTQRSVRKACARCTSTSLRRIAVLATVKYTARSRAVKEKKEAHRLSCTCTCADSQTINPRCSKTRRPSCKRRDVPLSSPALCRYAGSATLTTSGSTGNNAWNITNAFFLNVPSTFNKFSPCVKNEYNAHSIKSVVNNCADGRIRFCGMRKRLSPATVLNAFCNRGLIP